MEHKQKSTFQCEECNLYEEGLTDDEVLQLSEEHFKGNHIDIDELRNKNQKQGEEDKEEK